MNHPPGTWFLRTVAKKDKIFYQVYVVKEFGQVESLYDEPKLITIDVLIAELAYSERAEAEFIVKAGNERSEKVRS